MSWFQKFIVKYYIKPIQKNYGLKKIWWHWITKKLSSNPIRKTIKSKLFSSQPFWYHNKFVCKETKKGKAKKKLQSL